MDKVDEAIRLYGSEVSAKLQGPGEREASLTGPVSNLLTRMGSIFDLAVVAHDEVAELEGSVRPDFGIRVNGLLAGHTELKAPGASLDPSTYGKTTHNFKQWQRLRELPNLLHTNGLEWRLWRYGELVTEPIFLHASSLEKAGKTLTAPSRFEHLIRNFLLWEPQEISSVGRLVDNLAPLARMLREEVKLALQAERRAVNSGKPEGDQPFLGMARDWRSMLFPRATDDEFADGYAQTVTFALLLAVSEDIQLKNATLYEVAKKLDANHSLMGRTLQLLTEHIDKTPTSAAVEIILRVMSAVSWARLTHRNSDVYLHLYEHFLASYDPIARKKTGSYYTPVEVVDSMVRLTEMILKREFGRQEGFRHPQVSVVDPAMGTGTYPLSILRRVAEQAAAQYGQGAAPEAIGNAISRIYGLELQSGPYSVAELRISSAVTSAGAELPDAGLNLYVADTLEDPEGGSQAQLSYSLQLIAKQRLLANEMKRERNIQVCIGNPPYKRDAEGMGGWVESGSKLTGLKKGIHHSVLDDFRLEGNGRNEYVLKNLYVFFLRWAFWKTFESTKDSGQANEGDGIVNFITATGYLVGPGFKGLRKYIREYCSQVWIINVTPEGKTPPAANSVFNIETPVAIAIFVRSPGTRREEPADVKYISLEGRREKKFDELQHLQFDDSRWRTARVDWTAPFTPSADTNWDDFPAISDLFFWVAPGIKPNKGWVYGPTRDILEERLRIVVSEDNQELKKKMFRETASTSLSKSGTKPLHGVDVERETQKPFGELTLVTEPKIVRVGFRSFDRQWLIADSRLLHRASPDLWHGRIPGQLFIAELHSQHVSAGPGLTFSSLIPDMHYFKGSEAGRILPLLHPDGTPNLNGGVLECLDSILGKSITHKEIVAYIAGVVSHPYFVSTFDDELHTPGIRVPITKIRDLWDRAVAIGNRVIWLQTYGEWEGYVTTAKSILDEGGVHNPRYDKTVSGLPESISYDLGEHTLNVGTGQWSNVRPEVWGYTVGGQAIVEMWFDYRKKSPRGKNSSPLDSVNVTSWSGDWSLELTELLSAISQLTQLEKEQANLLDEILLKPQISLDELLAAGMSPPPLHNTLRKPRKRLSGELFEA
ncbi:type ISP restriction/modification enzyme [Rhodococcoides fascians]|uniref:type ISP restriction/modification enzyme n=1 Tax=Rhodococcoides fascians TaxID=1828 RepID=UPI003899C1FC